MPPFGAFFARLDPVQALVFLLIGLAFGAVLEMSGFGDSRKLAGQFYLREMTVLKVMFTAIVVACVLLFLAGSLGLLDLERVFVNPTYLPSGIAGGLIMGVGFIVGGFCPGTSIVSAATGKLDGAAFVAGALAGVMAFGESVSSFESFFNAAPLGRFTLPMWLGLPEGVVVLLLVLMALAMFRGAEIAEQMVGQKTPWREVRLLPRQPSAWAGSGALLALSIVLIARGQPEGERRFALVAAEEQPRLDGRRVYVSPAEVVELRKDPTLRVRILDLRSESDFNLFHLARSTRVSAGDRSAHAFVSGLQTAPDNTVFFLVGNGEEEATRAFRQLRPLGVNNLYIIEGGLNRWLDLYPAPSCVADRRPEASGEEPRYAFRLAVGDRIEAAHPGAVQRDAPIGCEAPGEATRLAAVNAIPFERKVLLQKKRVVRGGCG